MRDIKNYIEATQSVIDVSCIRDDFHELLEANLNNFLSANRDILGDVNLALYKSFESVCQNEELDGQTYITYNKLSGDISRLIHYLALEEFNSSEFLVYKLLSAIRPMLDDLPPMELFHGSEFAERVTSVTEMFILYHEIGHIEYFNQNPSQMNLKNYCDSLVNHCRDKTYENSLQNPKNREKMSLKEKEVYLLQILVGNSEEKRKMDVYESASIKEKVFCDIYSSNIIKEAYPEWPEETNAMICGISLVTYGIISTMMSLVEIIKTGKRSEEKDMIASMFRGRVDIFSVHLSLEKNSQEFIQTYKLYHEIDKALYTAWNLLSPHAGNVDAAKEEIVKFRFESRLDELMQPI